MITGQPSEYGITRIGVDYNEFEEGSYNGVYYILSDSTEKHIVNSGDFCKDLNETVAMLEAKGCFILYSSTLDNFMIDNKGKYTFSMEGDWMVEKKDGK